MSLQPIFPLFLIMAMPFSAVFAEWGAEVAAGGNPVAYYQEEIQKQQSQYRTKTSGMRQSLSVAGKIYYEWIGLRLTGDAYWPSNGRQNSQYQPQGSGQSYQNTETDGVPFAGAQTWRAELQLRRFHYGHRELFAFYSGILYRRVATELTAQPADYAPQVLIARYLSLGISFEPLLASFRNWELSLPMELNIGLKFPEGGIFDSGGGPGAVHLALGVRFGIEPRGIFFTAQGVVNFFDTPYQAGGATYTFSQVDAGARVLVGYYFRDPVYHE